jgi:hypothetical protein
MILQRDSKLFKFLTWHNDHAKFRMIESGSTDTCEVLKLALVSLIITASATLTALILLSCVGTAIGWFIASLLHGFMVPEGLAVMGIALVGGALLFFLVFFLSKIDFSPVITESVRSKLDKICTFIEVK